MANSDNNFGSGRGLAVVISGPSGVGKSTICREIVKRRDDIVLSISETTRLPGKDEVDGRDYYFVSREQFENRIREGKFLEHAEIFGNLYGTPKDRVDEQMENGKTVILEIDVQGALQAKKMIADLEMIFILPPNQKLLAERMQKRARSSEEDMNSRLNWASNEIAAAWKYYDHMVINDDLEQAIKEVIEIVDSNKTE